MMKKIAALLLFITTSVFAGTPGPLTEFFYGKKSNVPEVSGDQLYELILATMNNNKNQRGIWQYRFDFLIFQLGGKGCVVNIQKGKNGDYRLRVVRVEVDRSQKSAIFTWKNTDTFKLDRRSLSTGLDTRDKVMLFHPNHNDLFGRANPKSTQLMMHANTDVTTIVGYALYNRDPLEPISSCELPFN